MLANMGESDRRVDAMPVNWSDLGVSDLPTGTVTLLLADVEGSTGLWQTQPEEMTGRGSPAGRHLVHHRRRPPWDPTRRTG
jgi:class 3 adenylate cyclase